MPTELTYSIVVSTDSETPSATVVLESGQAIASLQITAEVTKEQIASWAKEQAVNYVKAQEAKAVEEAQATAAQTTADSLKIEFTNHTTTITDADLGDPGAATVKAGYFTRQ